MTILSSMSMSVAVSVPGVQPGHSQLEEAHIQIPSRAISKREKGPTVEEVPSSSH